VIPELREGGGSSAMGSMPAVASGLGRPIWAAGPS
jgi:hypothetical protein